MAVPGGVPARAADALGSLKLTLALLAVLVLLAAAATFVPAPGGERIYRGPEFVSALALLCVNVLVCTWRRFARRRRAGGGGAVAWADLAAHLSVVVILAGGAGKALGGFVGTQYLFLDTPVLAAADPRRDGEVALGRTLTLRRIEERFHPLQVRVGLEDLATGARSELVEILEGRESPVPGTDLRLRVESVDRDAGWVRLAAARAGSTSVVELSLLPEGRHDAEVGASRLVLVAWKHELKGVRGLISITGDRGDAREEWLAVNSRIAFASTSVFLTGWGRDDQGRRFLTIQVSRDPAAPVFWAGCLLFSVATPALLALRRRRRLHEEARGPDR